jgi:putative hydrolase of the HAD superfamily
MSRVDRRRAKAVFFDAGGTLLDPVEPVADTYLRFAREFAPTLDPQGFNDHFRAAWRGLNENFRSRSPDGETSEALEKEAWFQFTRAVADPFGVLRDQHETWLARLVEYFDRGESWRLVPEAQNVLTELRSSGLKLAVVSNWHDILESILIHHGLADQLDAIVISSRVGRKKPHREIFTHGLDQFGLSASEGVHVGDSWEEDCVGAIKAGMQAVHFDRTRDPEADPAGLCLESKPALPVIRSLGELPGLLL